MEVVLEVLVGVLSYAVVLAVVIVARRRRMSKARPPAAPPNVTGDPDARGVGQRRKPAGGHLRTP